MEIALIGFEFYMESFELKLLTHFLRENNKRVSLYEMGMDCQDKNLDIYMSEFQTMKEALPKDIDIFGFIIYDTNAHFIYYIAPTIKREYPNSLICVMGNLAANAYKYILNDCSDIDFAIRGDGEDPLLEVINAIENKEAIDNIESVVTRRNIDNDIPVAAFDISRIKYVERDLLTKDSFVNILGSKGCSGSCTFCDRNINKKWAGREIEDIFNEICILHEKHGSRFFVFADSTFDDPGRLGKERIRKLCNLLLNYPVKLSFRCQFRADTLYDDDKDLILLMKKVGFTQVFVGIESGNDNDLKLYGKGITVGDNHRTLRLFRECSVDVIKGFIMYHPFADEYTVAENYKFLSSHNEDRIKNYTNQLNIFYNTPIYHYFQKQNILGPDYSYLKPANYNFRNDFIRELHEFITFFYRESTLSMPTFQYYSLCKILYSLLAIFREHSEKHLATFQTIRESISQQLAEFFYHIYIDNDLDYAYKNMGIFEKELLASYKKAQNLKLLLMVRKPFSELFI